MADLCFEELEKQEEMDASDLGAVFGGGVLIGILIYVAVAT